MPDSQLLTPEQRLVSAKRDLGLPIVVVICGSTRFMGEMAEADFRETVAVRAVVRPGFDMQQPNPLWADPAEAKALKARLDDLHRAKIRLADEVLIVGDYIGDSTRSEIDYARATGKPIRYTHPEVNPYDDALPVVNCEIHLTSGDSRTVECVEPVPGLHVFEMPADLLEDGDGAANPWRLSHCSGRGLAAFPTQDDALRGVREIADLNDWTRTPKKLSTGPDFDLDEYLDRLLHRTNGLLIPQSSK